MTTACSDQTQGISTGRVLLSEPESVAQTATTTPSLRVAVDAPSLSSTSSGSGSDSSERGPDNIPTLRALAEMASSSGSSYRYASSSSGRYSSSSGSGSWGFTPVRNPPPSTGASQLGDDDSSSGFKEVGEVTKSPGATPAATTAAESDNTATIIGVAAGVFIVLLIVIIVFLLRRKKKQAKPLATNEPDMVVGLMASEQPTAPTRFPVKHEQLTSTTTATSSSADKTKGTTADASSTYYNSKSSTGTSTTMVTDDFPGALLSAVRIPFDELEIRDVISQGGFGEVAFGKYKNQDVAIKRLLASRRRNRKSVASFVQEIELNASLDHECLVRFIGAAWDVRENLCMVSEFMHGGDLRTLLDGYAQSGHPNGHDGGKMRTAVQVAQALAYLHALDPPVVHRDLKSRNILLTELLDAKLIDFGVSTEEQDETMTAGVGTSLWMAPEIMLGKRYDSKADIFSFGVILSELDTHEIPYDHARDPGSNRRLASAVLNRLIYEGRLKPRFTELADPEIVALARDCLEVDPSKRPTATQVLDRIRQARRGANSAAASGGFSSEGRSTSQQGRPGSPFDTRTRMNDTEF